MMQALNTDLTYLRRLAQAGRSGPPLGGLLMAAFGFYIGLGAAELWLQARGFSSGLAGPEFLAGLLVFAVIACRGPGLSRRRLAVAGAASAAAMAAVWASYAGALHVTGLIVRNDPDAWRTTPLAQFWRWYWVIAPVLALALVGAGAHLLVRLRRHPAAMSPGNAAAGALGSGAALAMIAIVALFFVQAEVFGARLPEDVTDPRYGLPATAMFVTLPALFWVQWGLAWWVWSLVAGRPWGLLIAAGSLATAAWYAATMDVLTTSVAGLFLLAFLPGLILIREAERAAGREAAEA